MPFARPTERLRDRTVRLLGVAIALGALAFSTYALAFAVSLLPFGGWVREVVFDAESAACDPGWVRGPQVVPAVGAVVLCGLALYRFIRPATPRTLRAWLLLVAGACILAGWIAVMDVADCGIGSDE